MVGAYCGLALLSLAVVTCFGQQNGELTLNEASKLSRSQLLKLLLLKSNETNDDNASTFGTDFGQDKDKFMSNLQKQLIGDVNGLPVLVQFTYVGPPKILPIATADSYPEGSSINLICTVSGGQRNGLTLSWQLNGQELTPDALKQSEGLENVSIDKADISILQIKNASYLNSGVYTCNARNPLGEDSTSVKIVVNYEMRWKKVPKDVEIGLNQELTLECDAVGAPEPKIEWTKLSKAESLNASGQVISRGKLLKIVRTQHKDGGLYECIAQNGFHEALRKVIQVKVRGK